MTPSINTNGGSRYANSNQFNQDGLNKAMVKDVNVDGKLAWSNKQSKELFGGASGERFDPSQQDEFLNDRAQHARLRAEATRQGRH